jgi:hypothetical protein
MTPPPLSTTCPLCDNHFTVPPAELRGAERWPGGEVERVAVECPVCAWEFTADGEGRDVDDGLDREGPFDISPDGGPDAEGLLSVTCPHCGRAHQTGEPGVTRCPRCRRLLPIDAEGEVEDETIHCYPCPRCAAPIREARAVATDVYCAACGYLEECYWGPWGEDDEPEEEQGPPTCPNCGAACVERGQHFGFLVVEGGRAQCPSCEWVFTPPPGIEEWFAAEGTVLPPPGFEGRDGHGEVVVYTVAADGSGDFTTVGQALAKARWQAASVRVRPGRYDERLVVEQSVELVADGPPGSVCLHSAAGPCLRIGRAGEVTVRGLRLESPGVAVEVSDGHPLLVDCSFHGGAAGVLVRTPQARPVLRGCRVEGGQVGVLVDELALATLEGCVVRGTAAAGIEVLGGGRLRLRRCRVLRAGGEGLCVRRDGEAELEECVLADGACAGVAVDRGKVRLARCQLHGCGVGCCVTGGLATLEDCAVRRCGTAGVSVLPGGQVLLRRCRLEDSPQAVCAAGLSRSLLDECELAGRGPAAAVVLRGRARARLRRCRLAGPDRAAVARHHSAEVALDDGDPASAEGPSLRAG